MRYNGHGALTLEDACTWLEETGLCLFLPKRQFSNSLAPSFVEAIAGQRNATPDQKQIAAAEDLLVRLEEKGVAVRLNLLGTPGEQPDYVVAAWVLPYVYALRGDRDWRRTPQLTGSRAVSPLAIQAYKRLESAGDASVSELKQALGQGVSEMGVLRAITELWQQLRIIPMVSAPGKAAKWQLLRIRFQKAIAEGASTSQVTAISVLASIYLQAVIAASMEEVEVFLSPLTARSKIREVLRGLVATRQVHTLSLGHAPHFYVAGTLPEFTQSPTVYASSLGSAYLSQVREAEDVYQEAEPAPVAVAEERSERAVPSNGNGVHARSEGTSGQGRARFARTPNRNRDRQASPPARRSSESRPARPASSRNGSSTRWSSATTKNTSHNGNGRVSGAKAVKSNGLERSAGTSRSAKPAASAWKSRNGSAKAGPTGRASSLNGRAAGARKDARTAGHASRSGRKPALAAGTNGKRYGIAAKGTKKQG